MPAHEGRRCTARARGRRPSWSAGNPVLATLPPCRPGHSAVQFRCGANRMEVIAMSDLETNKAIALRLVEVFNGRQLDRLEDVLHPKFRGRGIPAVVPGGPLLRPRPRPTLYPLFLPAIPPTH